MGKNFTQLYEDFEAGENVTGEMLIEGDIAAPKPSGGKETFVIKVPEIGMNFILEFC